jgi:hypothetical protein
MRRNIFFILAILLIGITFWMGEGGALLIDPLLITIALAGSFIITISFPGSLLKKVLVGIGVFAITVAAYFGGAYSFNSAYNECVVKGESVRVQLAEYYSKNKHYPENLKQLNSTLPGTRILRPTILNYKKTQDGYDLSFQDWLVEFKATQSEPFMAHK